MKIQEYLEIYEKCKVGVSTSKNLRTYKDSSKNIFIILNVIDEKTCKHCGSKFGGPNDKKSELVIEFNEPQEGLTVFEVWLLWMMFKENKIPYDYGGFHKGVYGQRFIQNIKNIH